jgi:hypothetical protein
MQARTFLLRGPGVEHHTGLRARYHVLVHAPGRGFTEHPNLHSIVLDKGKLIVSSIPVHTVRVTGDHFTWVQQSPGRYTSGHLYTLHNGLDIHGVAYIGTSPSDAVEHTFVGTAAKPAEFDTWVTKKSYPADTDPKTIADSEWEPGLKLVIDYGTPLGETHPRPFVTLAGNVLGIEETTWTYDQNGRTVIKINNDFSCNLGAQLYKLATLSFNPLDVEAHGWGNVSQLCGDDAPAKDGVRLWKAVPRAGAALRAAPALEKISREDIIKLSSTAELKLSELVTLLPDEGTNEETNRLFVRNMKWAMGEGATQKDWLTTLLGEHPPRSTTRISSRPASASTRTSLPRPTSLPVFRE